MNNTLLSIFLNFVNIELISMNMMRIDTPNLSLKFDKNSVYKENMITSLQHRQMVSQIV